MKRAAIISAVLVCAACSGGPEPEHVVFVLDPGFTQQTEQQGTELISLQDFTVAGDGHIYCADAGDKYIKVYTQDGLFFKQFGGEGQGPGEFLFPNAIAVSACFLYVADAAKRSISQYTLEGEFIRTLQTGSPVRRIDVFPAGAVVAEIASFSRSEDGAQSTCMLRLFSSDLEMIKEEIVSHRIENYIWITANEQGASLTRQLPYAPGIVWTIAAGRLYAGYSDRYHIGIYDENGMLCGEIERKTEMQTIPSREKQKWIKSSLDALSSRPGFSAAILRKSLEQADFPRHMPVFTAILRYKEGIAVLQPEGADGIPAVLYPDGDMHGYDGTLPFVYDDYSHGRFCRIETDSNGFQRLRAFTEGGANSPP